MTDHAIPGFNDAPAESIKVLQFSDTHLFADPDQAILGINTDQSLQEVLRAAQAAHWPADLILLTGDLAQDGTSEAYRRLQAHLAVLDNTPVYRLPGNHDDPAALHALLQGANVHAASVLLHGHWQIILLNSVVPNRVEGYLGQAELAMLDQQLARYPERHALICLHHPPIPVGSRWIDQLGLNNAADFFAVVDRHPQVRVVLCGHVHQEADFQRNGVRVLSAPSTCFQFRPGSDDFALDDRPPGYRWLVLHRDGSIATGIKRLEHHLAGVELHSAGY